MSAIEQLASQLHTPDGEHLSNGALLQGDNFHIQVDTTTPCDDRHTIVELGIVEGLDRPVAKIYLAGILAQFMRTHQNNMPETSETFDLMIQDILAQVYDLISAVLTERGDNTEWISDEENVHDNSVSASLNIAYRKLVELNNGEREYKMSNVLSYLLENHNDNFIGTNRALMDIRNIENQFRDIPDFEEDDENIPEYLEIVTGLIAELESVRESFDKHATLHEIYSRAVSVLMFCQRTNSQVMMLGASETEVILEVWRRIHSEANAEVRNEMLEIFSKNLADQINPAKEDGVECVSGRVGAVISALEVLDADNFVNIRSLPAMRVVMLGRAQKLVEAYIERAETDVIDRFTSGDLTEEETNEFKEMLRTELQEEFGDMMLDMHFQKIINEINSRVFG